VFIGVPGVRGGRLLLHLFHTILATEVRTNLNTERTFGDDLFAIYVTI